MNKIFAFLYANTIIFAAQSEELDGPSRGIDFGSWSKFAAQSQDDIQDDIDRSVDTSSQDEEEQKKGSNDE